MRASGWAIVVAAPMALAALAGCSGGGGAPPGITPETPAPRLLFETDAARCDNLLLFQFVEFSATDAYLPPGYRPRDPQDFLDSPAPTGQAALTLTLLECKDWQYSGEPLRTGFLGIYIDPPQVPGSGDPSPINFYEVERYGDDPTGALDSLGWPRVVTNVSFQTDTLATKAAPRAQVTDADGLLIEVATYPATEYSLADGPVRFWHDLEGGTGYFDYDFPLRPDFGPVRCIARAGSTLADIAGATTCPPADPLGATFPNLAFEGNFTFLPGIHTQ